MLLVILLLQVLGSNVSTQFRPNSIITSALILLIAQPLVRVINIGLRSAGFHCNAIILLLLLLLTMY